MHGASILTIGHFNRNLEAFVALLRAAEVADRDYLDSGVGLLERTQCQRLLEQ